MLYQMKMKNRDEKRVMKIRDSWVVILGVLGLLGDGEDREGFYSLYFVYAQP